MAAVEEKPILLVADPAPLGLAGFALTTFLLSGHNATFIPDLIWVGPALFYGGLAQLLAGMWEFRNRNVFGATAFSTYGAFWMSFGIFVVLLSADKRFGAAFAGDNVPNAAAWFLFAFLIFNTYMLIGSMRVSKTVFLVFLALEATELILVIGNFMEAHGHANSALGPCRWLGRHRHGCARVLRLRGRRAQRSGREDGASHRQADLEGERDGGNPDSEGRLDGAERVTADERLE